jgi:hypothetical protein
VTTTSVVTLFDHCTDQQSSVGDGDATTVATEVIAIGMSDEDIQDTTLDLSGMSSDEDSQDTTFDLSGITGISTDESGSESSDNDDDELSEDDTAGCTCNVKYVKRRREFVTVVRLFKYSYVS